MWMTSWDTVAGLGEVIRLGCCSGRTRNFRTLLWIRCWDTYSQICISLIRQGFIVQIIWLELYSLGWSGTHGDFPAPVLGCCSYKCVPTIPGFSARISLKKLITFGCVCVLEDNTWWELVLSTVWAPRISLGSSGLASAITLWTILPANALFFVLLSLSFQLELES